MARQRKRNAASFPTFCGRKLKDHAVPVLASLSGPAGVRRLPRRLGENQAEPSKQEGTEGGSLLQLTFQRLNLLGQRDIL
jgi:hypothetical protein